MRYHMIEPSGKIETTTLDNEKDDFYSCNVDANLYDKLEKHLFALRGLEGKTTKQSWITQAIQEKLKNEKFTSDIPKEKRLGFSIEKETHKEIEKRVELLKKFRTSYSKKQWFVEAFYEKLDRDTKLVQEGIERIKSSMI